MERDEQITQLIYEAIGEVNEMLEPEQTLERSPDTVLLGESGKLDSLRFVSFVVAVETNIERTFNEKVSLIDFMTAVEHSQWTVASLAKRIAEVIDQQRAQVSAGI